MLGDVPPASVNVSLQYTPLIPSAAHPHYYLAKLHDLSVNGTILPVDQVSSSLPSQICSLLAWSIACVTLPTR